MWCLPRCMAIALPVVLPFIDAPVVVLLAAGPPASEPPPAVAAGDCAIANLLLSASAPAIRMVLICMDCFLRILMARKQKPKSRIRFLEPGWSEAKSGERPRIT